MNALKAKVVGGRLVVDEPTELPEGTEVYLVPAEASADHYLPEDAFTPAEWARFDKPSNIDLAAALAWFNGEGPNPWLGSSS